ncbi:MAG: PLDc N-terminal domain-containing protein, partial [Parasporobacterium sp.]|nr:PLDc N-terminal domain-containing protein [Parasporobacterium sp.]
MNEDDFYRLAKPKKKGLLALLFSRFFIILILLVLQALVYVAIFGWLNKYVTYFYVVMTLFTLVMVIYLFVSRIDPSAKLTWLLIMAVLPFVGAVFLLYTQTNFGHRKLKEREAELIEATKTAILQSERVTKILKADGGDMEDLAIYLSRSGCFPAYDNTEVTYFPLGENKFEAMLVELEKAERFIFMEYFIIEEGYMWGKILEILVRKAAEGVDVRVMYDGMCEMSTLPVDYWKLLEKKGIRSKPFAPIIPVLSTHYNYRDHRKILVIDGKTAFNGGVNLADEYINRKERFGHWKDTAVMLKGAAVKSFTLLFLQIWNINEKQPEFLPLL